MFIRIRFLILVLMLGCASSQVLSAEFLGRLTARGNVIWNNAGPDSSLIDGISPTAWSLSGERATSEWYPGSFDNTEKYLLEFRDFNGNRFVSEVNLLGISYMLGSSASKFENVNHGSDIAAGYVNTCSTVFDGGGAAFQTVVHEDSGCVSKSGYRSLTNERFEPFKFYRPIISIPNLKSDIESMPSGVFSASFTTLPLYFFKSETGVLSKTQMLEPIVITIDYTSAELESIEVVGNGAMEAKYDKVTQNISGKTEYRIIMHGSLPKGVIMNFADYNKQYVMRSSDHSKVEIPYSIKCTIGCVNADKTLVSNGEFNISSFPDGDVMSIPALSGTDSVTAVYEISYDVKGEDVISSDYYGQFTVVYEVNL
ncbi:hypothetical protein [Vibrio campbellii]|uniref:hypothetical protein n=1 Tax=Vibrio campbellii TaxID=680 RepID=UPI000681D41D|nr:hypothetical protein [Vibrio campbellii]